MAVDLYPEGYPKHLFKFRSLGSASLEFTRQIVVENKIYLASPTEFNDPFDTLPNVVLDRSLERQRAYFRRLTRKYRPDLSRSERLRFAAGFMELPPQARRSHLRDGLIETAHGMAVCSFAETPNEVLMWSHYAQNPTGICLRFGTGSEFFRASLPLQIAYADERPTYNPIVPGSPTDLIDLVLTKARFWSYEREWRIVETRGRGIRSIPPEALEAVYFGCRTSEEHKRLIRTWIAQRGLSLELFQGEAAEDTFDLHFIQIA